MKYLILIPILAMTGCVTQWARDHANNVAEKQMSQGFYGWGSLAPPPVDWPAIRSQQTQDALNRQILWELQYGGFNETLSDD